MIKSAFYELTGGTWKRRTALTNKPQNSSQQCETVTVQTSGPHKRGLLRVLTCTRQGGSSHMLTPTCQHAALGLWGSAPPGGDARGCVKWPVSDELRMRTFWARGASSRMFLAGRLGRVSCFALSRRYEFDGNCLM